MIVRFAVAALVLLAAGRVHATNVNPFTDLGSAGPSNWQILTLGHCSSGSCNTATTNVTVANFSSVDGNVGVAPSGNLSVVQATDGEVYGNASVYSHGTVGNIYEISGTISQSSATDTLLDNASTAAMKAYTDATGDTATSVTCSGTGCSTTNIVNPSGAITITGGSGLNVIDLTNLELNSGSESLTLSAPSNGYFVINVSGTFSVGSSSTAGDILVAGGLSQLNVLYNVEGTGSAVAFNGTWYSTDVQGIVLAPYRDIALNGATVDGEVISGNLNLTINYSNVDVPEPATLLFLATGLAGLGMRIRRRN
jgi:choice-of-anchor A domain-containing protein